jgi:hypothetical protein
MIKPINIIIAITCIVILSYFGVLLYKELRPKTLTEQKMHCLELGSNERARSCLILLNKSAVSNPKKTTPTHPQPTVAKAEKRLLISLGSTGITATNISNKTLYKCFFTIKAKGDKYTEYKGFYQTLTNEDFNGGFIWALSYETNTGAKDVIAKLQPQESTSIPFSMFYEYNSKPVNQTFNSSYSDNDVSSVKVKCNNIDGNSFEETTIF